MKTIRGTAFGNKEPSSSSKSKNISMKARANQGANGQIGSQAIGTALPNPVHTSTIFTLPQSVREAMEASIASNALQFDHSAVHNTTFSSEVALANSNLMSLSSDTSTSTGGGRILPSEPSQQLKILLNELRAKPREKGSDHIEVDYQCGICSGFIEDGEPVAARKFCPWLVHSPFIHC